MQKITPCLWFDGEAEKAARFYISLFKNSKIERISHYPDGKVLLVAFRLAGQSFQALNGGPQYQFTPALSLSVSCKNQGEVDRLWKKLTSGGGKPIQCGWLEDKFGVSWQIVPDGLGKLLEDRNPERASRAMKAMLKMKKLDLAALQRAAVGR